MATRKAEDEGEGDAQQGRRKEPSYHTVVSTYTSRFEGNGNQADVTEAQRRQRLQTAVEGSEKYYEFTTSAYERGWSQHFHYCPFAPGEPIQQAMVFYEHRLAHLMGLKPGMKVLDVGCGIGAPAREIAKFVGCEIVGISINQSHVDRARELTKEAGLENKVVYIRGDFTNLPFPDASFDAAYGIESTCHAPSLAQVYSSIARVLKPGAVFGLSEWVMTAKYDSSDARHVAIRNRIEYGNGIANMQTSEQARAALRTAGFTISHDQDYAQHWARTLGRNIDHVPQIPGHPSTPFPQPGAYSRLPAPPPYRPWYYPLVGRLDQTVTWTDWWITFCMTPFVRVLWYYFVAVLERIHLYPKGSLLAMSTIFACVDSVVEGGKEDLFTPCWWFIATKAGNTTTSTTPTATAIATATVSDGGEVDASGSGSRSGD